MCVITNLVSSPISLKSAHPCRYLKSSLFSPSLSFNFSLLHSHCPSLLRHPSRHASLPFTFPIVFSHFYPLLTLPSILSLFLLHDTFSVFFFTRVKNKRLVCWLPVCLQPLQSFPYSGIGWLEPLLCCYWLVLAGEAKLCHLINALQWGEARARHSAAAVSIGSSP